MAVRPDRVMADTLIPETPLADETTGIARSASIIALGSLTSRLLGFARDGVMAPLFGAGARADALVLAITIPLQIYELVTGGVVNSALVPIFSAYATPARRHELWRLASVVLTVAGAGVSLLAAVLVWLAPQVVALFAALGQGAHPEAIALAVPLLRITLPAVVFLSLSGVLSGLLYSLKRFTYPAFTAAIFNLSMVVFSLLLAWRVDVAAMAIGLLVGAVLQVLLQLPGLRDALPDLRPRLALDHPGLRRILRLYVPIIGSLIVTQASVYIGLGLALRFEGGLSWMRYATTLYQFPVGLVAVAVTSAILPTLSRQAAQMDENFKTTLVRGMNLVTLLIIPAAVGLFVLAEPIVSLVFERGRFTPQDTLMTALVLRIFLFGMSFAAIDQMLIAAYYARQNTLVPALVGVLSVAVYLAVALLALERWGLLALMLADSAKQITHAVVMGALLSLRIGGFRQTTLWGTLGRVVFASLVMAGLASAVLLGVQRLGLADGLLARLLAVSAPGLVGALVYFWLADRLAVSEVRLALDLLRKRLGL
jgi:putative peptidoglycan lipid II flippase